MRFGAALMASLGREIALIRKDGWDFALLFIIPPIAIAIVAAIFFSGAFQHVPVAVVDADHSALSRSIERNLRATPKIRIIANPSDLSAAWSLLRANRSYAVIYLPPGLERDAVRQQGGSVIIYFNAAFQTIASQAADAARNTVQAAIAANVGPQGIGLSSSPVRVHLPKIQVSVIGNPQGSFERFLETLATPLVLNLLLSGATVFAIGREGADGSLADWSRECGNWMLPALIGKLIPYVFVYWLWCVAWTAYLAGWRGWPVEGSFLILFGAQLAFFTATGAISAMLCVVFRKLDQSLSIAALYAGSGLSFANATLPMNGAFWLTRVWSAVLPSTSYVRIQEQQWVLGSPLRSAAHPFLVLVLFIIVPMLIATRGLGRIARSDFSVVKPSAIGLPASFVSSLLKTLRIVVQTQPILSTVIFAVVLYGFYYPSAYKVQTVIKLPVAIVDLDRSPLSRMLIRNLSATREIDIVAQPLSVAAAKRLLIEDKVDGVVAIPDGLGRSVLNGTPGGVDTFLKGAYLVRSRFLGQALGAATNASIQDFLAPVKATERSKAGSVETIERPLYNTINGYGDYTVPGVASVILQATLLFGVAMFMGLRGETAASRMTTPAFLGVWSAFTLLGSVMSFFFFGFVLWFQDYPRGGNLAGLLICVPVFCAGVSALGLLIGSYFQRHERSMQILGGTSIPVFFLSGLSWPGFGMPALVVGLAKLIPSTTAVPMFIQLNSMGASLQEVAPELGTLIVLAILYAAAACRRLTQERASSAATSRNLVAQ